MRNVARRVAAYELSKNSTDDLGFGFDDHQSTRLTGLGGVAIGPTAGMALVLDHASHAPPCLCDAIFALQLSDDGAQADSHGVGSTVVHGPNLNPAKCQAFVQPGKVFHVSRQPVESFNDHNIEGADLALFDEA